MQSKALLCRQRTTDNGQRTTEASLCRLRDYETTRQRVASHWGGFGGDICVGSKNKCVDVESIE